MRLLASATCLALLAATLPSAQTPATGGVSEAQFFDRFIPLSATMPESAKALPAGAVSDAQINRLIRVLPNRHGFNIEPKMDERQLASLKGLYPGHEQELRTILIGEAACLATPARYASIQTLRTAARNLGPEKVERLTSFYEGPNSRTIDRFFDDARKTHRVSEAEANEVSRLASAYPLQDWDESLGRSIILLQDDRTYQEAIARCASERKAALGRVGLRRAELSSAGLRSAPGPRTTKLSNSDSK